MYKVDVVGHKQQRLYLEKLLNANQLPHSLLFTGPAGVGKRGAALELAKKLICTGEDSEHLGTVFEAGNCPDFYIRDCGAKNESSTQEIRELLSSLSYTAFGGTNRVVVLDNVEHLSIHATNALLKIIEEPRAGLHFILVTANKAALLPTVVSRCQVWQFNELSASQVATIIERNPEILGQRISSTELPYLTELADGSVANIRFIYENLEHVKSLEEKLNILAKGSRLTAIQLAQEISKNKDSMHEDFSLLRTLIRRKMLEADEKQAAWSYLLSDILQLDWIIFERNINAYSALQHTFLAFARFANSPNFALSYPSVTEQIV